MNGCTITGCERQVRCKGLCNTHYNNSLNGRPLKQIGLASLEQRFQERVNAGEPEQCWPWLGSMRGASGYGQIGHQGKSVAAHRLAWELAHGQAIPAGMIIDHRCHNRACVNPRHLQLADKRTNGENRAGADSDSRSGIRGVSWDERNRAWVVYAGARGKTHNGGRFKDIKAAEEAAIALRNRLHTNNLTDRKVA